MCITFIQMNCYHVLPLKTPVTHVALSSWHVPHGYLRRWNHFIQSTISNQFQPYKSSLALSKWNPLPYRNQCFISRLLSFASIEPKLRIDQRQRKWNRIHIDNGLEGERIKRSFLRWSVESKSIFCCEQAKTNQGFS